MNSSLEPVSFSTSTELTNHSLGQIFTSVGWQAPAWPLLLIFILILMNFLFGKYIWGTLKKVNPIFQIDQDMEVDESIDNYFASLDAHDRDWAIKEERNSREMLHVGIPILTHWQFKRLIQEKETTGKTLMGTHTYDILGNPFYSDYFQYVSSAVTNRSQIIIDSDSDDTNNCAQSNLTKLALNLGYLKLRETRNFDFSKESLYKVEKYLKEENPNKIHVDDINES